MQYFTEPQPLERRLHRGIKSRIDPRWAVTMRPVPSVHLPQFGGELLWRRGLFQGRIALAVAEDHQPGRIGPSPEIGRMPHAVSTCAQPFS